MNKIKVLHILSSKTYNGAENVVCQINSMLQGTKDNIELIYCSLDGPVRSHIEECKIRFIPVSRISKREIVRVIQEIKPDIIHAHDMRASFVAALACKKIPLVSHIHNNNFDSRGLSLKSVLYFYAAIKAKHIFWVSKSSFDGYRFHNLLDSKSEILFNVIDVKALYKKAELDENTYDYDAVYLGRLTYQKNPQRLIEVLSKVIKKMPGFTAAILGDGEDVSEIKRLIRNNNIQNNVTYLGFSDNPYKVLQTSKLMIMTSRWEGTPMCALEAIAMGVPIVSTPVDGMCDLIVDNQNGYLSDDNEELARRCFEIASNDALQKRLSYGAKQTAERIMNVESYRNTISSVYHRIVR